MPPGESKGTQGLCVWMPFIIRNKNIYGLGVATWTVCKMLDILTFSPYKCLCYQIWLWPKIGQSYPRVTIWTNYDGPRVPNATYQVSWKSAQRFQRRKFLKGFYHIWAWRSSWSCDPRSGSLNVSYHKEQEYIWFRGGDPNSFWAITHFMK